MTIEPLAHHRCRLPLVAEWFVGEWPGWYGPGGQGDLSADLAAFAASDIELPLGLLVIDDGQPVGIGALKVESIPSHRHLTPWAAAGYVLPQRRGQGIGALLLRALVDKAGELGHSHVYCGTSTAQSLLLRSGWTAMETTLLEGKPLTIFGCATWSASAHKL
jgi:GNAT superfamily N-acetyltransferase